MDLLTDLQAETAHLTLQIILDQVTETTATPATTNHTTDRDTTGDNNRNRRIPTQPKI